ncbi:helix-turn-helix transcriptional regulator [bacterium]|nr:helix-turn-helix transcriptional regulator [bacterium]
MTKENTRSGCPVSIALDVIGDKWTLLIIRDMLFFQKKYYNEFLASDEKIATNILSDRLKKLETEGFVTKSKDSKNRSKNIYKLSQKAIDLLPILLELIRWGNQYSKESLAPEKFIEKLKSDREQLISDIIENLPK